MSREKKRRDIVMLYVYHTLELISLLLSLNVVVTSTSASTMLLLEQQDSVAKSAYAFIRQEAEYEFVLTRWSYLVSLMSFMAAISARMLLEFDLLKPGRGNLAMVVLLSFVGLMTHLLSYINSTLHGWPDLVRMGWYAIQMVFHRAVVKQHPLQIISLLAYGGAAIFGIRSYLQWKVHAASRKKIRSEDTPFE